MRDRKYLLYVIVLAVIVLVNLPVIAQLRVKSFSRDNLFPFQSMMSVIAVKFRAIGAFLMNPGQAREEKRRLIEEVVTLHERIRTLEVAEQDNENLRKQLGFQKLSRRKLISCEVISRDEISGWWQTITLNKGTDDGVFDGKAVITIEGVIGKTMLASRRTCDVLLVSDPNCRIACKFTRTGGLGIVRGSGLTLRKTSWLEMLVSPGPNQMDYISRENEIWAHDEVVTSGLGGVFPEGLLLGHVSKVALDESGLYQRAEVFPAADLSKLRYVFVVVQ